MSIMVNTVCFDSHPFWNCWICRTFPTLLCLVWRFWDSLRYKHWLHAFDSISCHFVADYGSIGFAELTNIGICLKLFAFHDKYYKYEKIRQGNLLWVRRQMREMAKLLNWQILVWLCPTAEPQTDQNNNEWDDDDDNDWSWWSSWSWSSWSSRWW